MPETKTVMINGASLDLPEHRAEVRDACLRVGMLPMIMESLPASDDNAIRASLQMVEQVDLYLGIFGHRYGYVPAGHEISITERVQPCSRTG
jgi:hypothetical protein